MNAKKQKHSTDRTLDSSSRKIEMQKKEGQMPLLTHSFPRNINSHLAFVIKFIIRKFINFISKNVHI